MQPFIGFTFAVALPLLLLAGILVWMAGEGRVRRLWTTAGIMILLILAVLFIWYWSYEQPEGPLYAVIPMGVLPVLVMAGVIHLATRRHWPRLPTGLLAGVLGIVTTTATVLWAYTVV